MLAKKLLFSASLFLFITGCSTKHQHSWNPDSYQRQTPFQTAPEYSPNSSYSGSGSTSTGKKRSSAAIHRATMRPYVVHGKKYYPSVVQVGAELDGISSWYGPNFHGKYTSNGEVYDMHAMTAAHKTLPMNTIVKVYNKNNGKTVQVRINDRGPFVAGRIIDLSFAAGKQIGLDKTGIAPVTVTVIAFDTHVGATATGSTPKTEKPKTYHHSSSFAVQIGAFRNKEGATKVQTGAKKIYTDYNVKVKEFWLNDAPIYRVWVTGFKSEDEAKDFISENGITSTYIVAE